MIYAIVTAAIVGLALLYALHAILILRWCGMWTRNRLLTLWIGQMLFPITTGLGAWVLGNIIGDWLNERLFGFGFASITWLNTLVWTTPPVMMYTGMFILVPTLTMPRRWKVWAVALAAAPAAIVILTIGLDGLAALTWRLGLPGRALMWGLGVTTILGWHIGALGGPLWLAWRVRKRHQRELAGHLCLDCGYDLSRVTLDRCPECGARRRDEAAAQPA